MATKPLTPQEIIKKLNSFRLLDENRRLQNMKRTGKRLLEKAKLLKEKAELSHFVKIARDDYLGKNGIRIGDVIEFLVNTSVQYLWEDLKKLIILWSKDSLWGKSLEEIELESGYRIKSNMIQIHDSYHGKRLNLCNEEARELFNFLATIIQ